MHYQQGKNREQVFMTSLSSMVVFDSWARLVDVFVDALPIEEMGFQHSTLNKEGNLPYHPGDLFKLLLYGYRHGIRSANKLHEATLINVEVMWLLKGLRPSARTINYFRSNNTKAIEQAHRHFVKLLKSWKLIDGSAVALDGVKIRGQNSLKLNFNAKKIERHLEYIENKMIDYLDQLDEVEKSNYSDRKKKEKRKEIAEKQEKLQERKAGYEQLAQELEQSGEKQISRTDPDARAVIKHRNIVEVGYNIQVVADAKNNMVIDVFAGGVNDMYELSTAAKRTQEILDKKYIDMLADKGYHNGVELAIAERCGVRPFVSPKTSRPQKEKGFRKEDFDYDAKSDTYTCPAGQALVHELTYKKNSFKKPYKVKRYGTDQCQNCPLKNKCTTSDRGRKIERPLHQPYIDRNNKRVTRYKDFYRLRAQIIEHIFGTWKRQWGLDHTLLKGREKVITEYRIAALAYNLRRSLSILGWEGIKKRLNALVFVIFSIWRFISVHDTSNKGFGKLIYSRA